MSYDGGDYIVKLDVGGMIFKTTKSTLMSHDGYFKKMMEMDEMTTLDENGSIFIDRDPKHFRLILNFMRDGHVDLPDSIKDLQELKKEAEMYQLDKLYSMCVEKVPMEEKCKFKLIESDMELVQIITNPKKPVLIIYYKMENWENATKYFDITKFQEKHGEQFDIYFKSSTSTTSNTWSYSIHDRVPNVFSQAKACQENNFLWSLENAIGRFLESRKNWF